LIIVNYANADMVGHTGNIDATIIGCETIDACIGSLSQTVLAVGGVLLITADHGNAEEMINRVTGEIDTEHNANPFIITDVGEYEIRDVLVTGIASSHDSSGGSERGSNIIYRLEIDDVSIAHLGDLGHPLENGQLQKLEGVDILLIPVGGVYTIDGKTAVQIINQIEPRLIIPMHYKIPGLKLNGKMVDGLEGFCKEIGICPKEPTNKLKISKKDLPQEDMQVVVLTA